MPEFTFVDDVAPIPADDLNRYVRDQLLTICTVATRPPAPVIGRHIYETDTGNEYFWDSTDWVLINVAANTSAWTAYTPTWDTNGTDPAYGNANMACKYRLIGKTLDWSMYFATGTTTVVGTGIWYFTLPLGLTVAAPYSMGCAIILYSGYYWEGQLWAQDDHVSFYVPTSSSNFAYVNLQSTHAATVIFASATLHVVLPES